jgi:hypothetical protein
VTPPRSNEQTKTEAKARLALAFSELQRSALELNIARGRLATLTGCASEWELAGELDEAVCALAFCVLELRRFGEVDLDGESREALLREVE